MVTKSTSLQKCIQIEASLVSAMYYRRWVFVVVFCNDIISYLSGFRLIIPLLPPNALANVSFVWLQLLPFG